MKSGYLYINDNVLETLLAISEQEQAQGLMGKKWLPPVMSFIYFQPKINKFWMHNTPSPLDILFCYKGVISQICKGEPHSTAMIGDNKFSDLVVELPAGTVKELNIKVGNFVKLAKPTVEELKIIVAAK